MTGCFFYKSWYSWKKVFCPSSLTGSWLILALFISKEFCLPTTNSHPPKRLVGILLGSVQSLSHVQLFGTPWTAVRQASLFITNSQSLLKLMSIESVMPSNHLILCRPLLLSSSIFPSIRVFSSESVLRIRWPNYWSFSFNISPSNEYSGLISFRMDWLDLLAVQVTFKSLLQHHSSKASILWHSAFLIVQLLHPYMTKVWHCFPIYLPWSDGNRCHDLSFLNVEL